MNETYVTFQGWMGTDVTERAAGDAVVAQFRVGSTPRRFNRRENAWVDGETTWYTVNAWRTLARNCIASLKNGDPVVVHGRLSTQVWDDGNGHRTQSCVVDAISVGHDLNRGASTFTKKAAGYGEVDEQSLRQANAELGVGGPQISSDGHTLDDLVGRVRETAAGTAPETAPETAAEAAAEDVEREREPVG